MLYIVTMSSRFNHCDLIQACFQSSFITTNQSIRSAARVLCSLPTNSRFDSSPQWVRGCPVVAPSTHTETKPSMTSTVLRGKMGCGFCQTGATVVPGPQRSGCRRRLITGARCPEQLAIVEKNTSNNKNLCATRRLVPHSYCVSFLLRQEGWRKVTLATTKSLKVKSQGQQRAWKSWI